jgi:lipoyl(octanoyl) transferase
MAPAPAALANADHALQVYLLGSVDFEEMLRCQRRVVYEVSGDRSRGVLFLCEHPPHISVGRDGSREHIDFEPADLAARGWPVRWVNRGGGCLLSLPGQLAVYPVLALDRLELSLQEYLDRLHAVLIEVLTGFGVAAAAQPGRAGVWSNDRLISHVGVAVREWVAYFGAAVNVHPDLEPFRRVRCAGPGEPPMTSIARELREPVREATVRQRLIESFARRFGFPRTSLFHHHPALNRPAPSDAVTTRSG